MRAIYFAEPDDNPLELVQETESSIRGGDTGAPLGSLSPMCEDVLNAPIPVEKPLPDLSRGRGTIVII
jgi:hypothetical protein